MWSQGWYVGFILVLNLDYSSEQWEVFLSCEGVTVFKKCEPEFQVLTWETRAESKVCAMPCVCGEENVAHFSFMSLALTGLFHPRNVKHSLSTCLFCSFYEWAVAFQLDFCLLLWMFLVWTKTFVFVFDKAVQVMCSEEDKSNASYQPFFFFFFPSESISFTQKVSTQTWGRVCVGGICYCP